MAKKQILINAQNKQKALIAAKNDANSSSERKQIMADGLIHRADGTIVDPATHLIVDGANSF